MLFLQKNIISGVAIAAKTHAVTARMDLRKSNEDFA
jgi:hypothetical protein